MRHHATDISSPTGESNRCSWRTRPSTWQSAAYGGDSSIESVASIHCVRHADRSGAPSSAPIRRTNSSAFVELHDAAVKAVSSMQCARSRNSSVDVDGEIANLRSPLPGASRHIASDSVSDPNALVFAARVLSDGRATASSQATPRRSISPPKRKPCTIRSPRTRRTRRRRSVDRPPPTRARHDAGHRSSEASCTSAIRLRSRASRPDIRPDRGNDEDPERHR